jgi:hypothetical protein
MSRCHLSQELGSNQKKSSQRFLKRTRQVQMFWDTSVLMVFCTSVSPKKYGKTMESLESLEALTTAQKELYDWLVEYINKNQHSPSIRQMMRAMELKSPAPVQSRLDHLKKKGYIAWEEGQARTIRLLHTSRRVYPLLARSRPPVWWKPTTMLKWSI